MPHKLIEQLYARCEIDKQDSDFAYFWALLLTGEAIAKTIVLGLLAGIEDDTQRNRYRLLYNLVRANGIGDWSQAVEEASNGPASQYLIAEAQAERLELTNRYGEGEWQYEAVSCLRQALDVLDIATENVPTRTDLTRWFRMFATLRNKSRGHGAMRPAKAGEAAPFLFKSIDTVYRNFQLFRRPWVYLHRNMSGKYRATVVDNESQEFDFLKRESNHALENGVYIFFDSPRRVELIFSDAELSDFFLPNGAFSAKSYDLISYATGDKQSGDSSQFRAQPDVQESETQGYGELVPKGNCFSNAPEPASDYVERPELEGRLFDLLIDDRHPVVTLQGAGGVGKTSSTLQVLGKLYEENRFEMIVWFSARDIDLLSSGPRTVRPAVLSPDDISKQYAALVLSEEQHKKMRSSRKKFFQDQLRQSDGGTCLFIFDNFETVQSPVEMFDWIEGFITLPNKVLITTRLRDFKGDYPLEVHGMTDQESRMLIDRTASALKIRSLLNENRVNELIRESGGHPYVMKILLGEMAVSRKFGAPRHIVAGSDDILTALFQRTFEALSPCGKRAFLTLAAWNSAVPRVALEAVLMGSTRERTEVEKGIEALLNYSLAETSTTREENQEYIYLPLAASEFGKKQLRVHIWKSAIQNDVDVLQMFSPTRISDVNLSLARSLERFIRNLSERIDSGESIEAYKPILTMVCRAYNPGWLSLAQWHLERGGSSDIEEAIQYTQYFLQEDSHGPDSPRAWHLQARACYKKGDALGEIHAFVERAQFDLVAFHDVSNTANLLNRSYGSLELDHDDKRQLARQLLAVLEKRSPEAGPDDFSRMAWLALHLNQSEKAKHFVSQGLEMAPDNEHCLRLFERLVREEPTDAQLTELCIGVN